ncbi:hypothetical protein LY90DRAFT_509530 [Neocallimastix californiae]|uniref:Uncharacterized protein n=1 Tax=Neocallimastix californiae TaxID=1754190 RepID=A0A1Y2CD66_9FUNG|nr:hypothetical protein LY90DRAFT_509530 [Neocallimastix californiae]|eukprot:ORY44973.1 hypothetical protein LY90DRAFT_509530 [Neocallimastix californiae]
MVFYLDCYNRNEHTSMRFVPNNRDNPDDCDIKGYVNIKKLSMARSSHLLIAKINVVVVVKIENALEFMVLLKNVSEINPIIVTKASTLVPYKEMITALFVSSVVISAVLSVAKIFDLLLPI